MNWFFPKKEKKEFTSIIPNISNKVAPILYGQIPKQIAEDEKNIKKKEIFNKLKPNIIKLINNYYRKDKYIQCISKKHGLQINETFDEYKISDCDFSEDAVTESKIKKKNTNILSKENFDEAMLNDETFNALISLDETNDPRIKNIVKQFFKESKYDCDKITTDDADDHYALKQIPCPLRYLEDNKKEAEKILEKIVALRNDDIEFFTNSFKIKTLQKMNDQKYNERQNLIVYIISNVEKCYQGYLKGGKKTKRHNKKTKKSKKSRKTKRRHRKNK